MRHYLTIAVVAFTVGLSPTAFAKGGGGHSSSHHTSSGSSSGGSHGVSGHVTKNGTYVAPHHATNPNTTRNDNWSTKGNVNPHTGKEGTKPRDGEHVTTKP